MTHYRHGGGYTGADTTGARVRLRQRTPMTISTLNAYHDDASPPALAVPPCRSSIVTGTSPTANPARAASTRASTVSPRYSDG